MILIFLFTGIFLSFPLSSIDLEKVRELRDNGKTEEALQLLLKSNYSNDIEAERILARLYLDTNRFQDAIKIYNKICKLINTHDCYNEMGIASVSLGQYNEGAEQFEKSIQLNGASAIAYSNLAQAYFRAKNMEKCEEAHLKALEMSPENPIIRINYGVFLVKNKRYTDAKLILGPLTEENSTLYFAELYMGIAHYMKEEYNAALMYLNRGIKINPEYYDLYYYRALIYYKRGDFDRALHDLKKVDKLSPDNKKGKELRKLVMKDARP